MQLLGLSFKHASGFPWENSDLRTSCVALDDGDDDDDDDDLFITIFHFNWMVARKQLQHQSNFYYSIY